MARQSLHRSSEFAYHLTLRSNSTEGFYISNEQCWSICRNALYSACERYGVFLYAAVQMPNYLYLIVSTPRANLGDFMRYFVSEATRYIQYNSGRINHIFGCRYKWSFIDSAVGFAYVYKFALRSPLREGLSDSLQVYPYSSFTDPRLPLVEGFDPYWDLIPKNQMLREIWLMARVPQAAEQMILRGLRRYFFRFSRDNTFGKSIRLLHASYGVVSK